MIKRIQQYTASNPYRSLILAYLAFLLLYGIIKALTGHGGDFKIYMGAAELLYSGESPYFTWIETSPDAFMQYSYPPVFAMILIPFAGLPLKLVLILWVVLNTYLLWRVLDLAGRGLELQKLGKRQQIIMALLLILLSCKFLLHNLDMMQMSVLMLYCGLYGAHLIFKGRTWQGAATIALGVSWKLLPLAVLPYLLVKRQFLAGVLVLLVGAFAFLSPALIWGWGHTDQLYAQWWEVVNPTNQEFTHGQNAAGEGVVSLTGWVPAYLSDAPENHVDGMDRSILSLTKDQIFYITTALQGLLVLFAMLFLVKPIWTSKSTNGRWYELSYVLGAVPLVFPHQQKYALVLLIPAIVCVSLAAVDNSFTKARYNWLMGGLIGVIVLLGLSVFMQSSGDFFKIPTFMAILVLVTLYLVKPRYENHTS